MAIEKVKELIKAVKTDPKAKELLQGVSEPKSEEDMIRLCVEVAPKLGFDITADEIRAGVTEMERERREKTSAGIEKLSDEDAAKASGGICWTGEDAPDGHELGCWLFYHDYDYQKKNDIWCERNAYCITGYYSPAICTDDWV